MACFIVPGTEAIVTTIVTKVIENKENKEALEGHVSMSEESKERLSRKLKRLNGMLWGGSGLLAFEHLWHGEITPFFPFLTAASSTEATSEMLHEMSTVGVAMAVLVTAVWAGMTVVLGKIEKRNDAAESIGEES